MLENATQQKPNVAAGDSGKRRKPARPSPKPNFGGATETNRLTCQAHQTKKLTEQTEAKTKQGKGKNQTTNEKRKPEPNQKTIRHHRS